MKTYKQYEAEQTLPSSKQIKDIVTLDLGDSGKIENCRIAEVHFEEGKVYYDVEVLITKDEAIRLHHVDSVVVK